MTRSERPRRTGHRKGAPRPNSTQRVPEPEYSLSLKLAEGTHRVVLGPNGWVAVEVETQEVAP